MRESRSYLNQQGQASLDSTSPEDTTNTNGSSSTKPEEGTGGEDILAALEKIPGVGSLRSVAQSSSIGSSLPSLNNEKVKREESSHSLGSQVSLMLVLFNLV